jgi:hypothetical protein
MSIVRAVLATVLLAAFAVHSADAQSKFAPLTNGDIIRLVTMRVSDQTVIAVINEAAPHALTKHGREADQVELRLIGNTRSTPRRYWIENQIAKKC